MNDRQDMTITEFCDVHGACGDGREWAVRNCKTMHDVWRDAKPEWLIWVATREGVLDDRTLRLFACWSVRQVWHLLTDERSRHAVEVAERYASGCATDEELAAAMDAAWDAALDAAMAVSRAAVEVAERYASGCATDEELAAAMDAPWDAAWAAAWVASRDAAWVASRDAVWAASSAAASAAADATSAAAKAAEDAASAVERAAARAAQAEWLRQHATPSFRKEAI